MYVCMYECMYVMYVCSYFYLFIKILVTNCYVPPVLEKYMNVDENI